MSVTKHVTGQELKETLLAGVKKLNDVVSSTLGPGGRTVLIRDANGEVKITKDGVSAARAFAKLEDDIEDIGAQAVKQVSIKSANEAGDGTTTSTLLAATIIEQGLKEIRQGSNAVEIKREIDKLVVDLVDQIKSRAIDVSTQDQIKQVATISGNNDPEIGQLIASSIEKVGREGIVTIQESKTGETSLEVVEGIQFDRGYKSPYFVTDNSTMNAVLEDAYVFIYDGRISTAQELLQVLTKANSESKPLLIIAEDIGDEALATLIVNKMRGIVNVVAVKAPDFGDRKTLLLEDIAIITGGQVMTKNKGHKIDKITPQQLNEFLGRARRVNVSKEETTIIDGKGEVAAIEARAEEIKAQIDKAQSFYEKEKLQERLGKLVGGVAIVHVGGNSEVEIKEKKDRLEDALYATKAALADGVVPGGGSLLYQLSKSLNNEGGNDGTAKWILRKSLQEPFIKILSNAGVENWWEFTPEEATNQVYDAKNHVIVDAFEAGIIDPAKVVITALRNASSVAGTILTTESVIFEKEDKKDAAQSPQMGY